MAKHIHKQTVAGKDYFWVRLTINKKLTYIGSHHPTEEAAIAARDAILATPPEGWTTLKIGKKNACKCGHPINTKATYCKACAKEYSDRWHGDLLKNSPAAYLLKAAKRCSYVAGRRGSMPREVTITEADIVIPDRCPVFGWEFDFNLGGKSPRRPSLDRIDSSKGYVPGNVQVISWRANQIKTDATPDEIAALNQFMSCQRKTI